MARRWRSAQISGLVQQHALATLIGGVLVLRIAGSYY
jgi:hypothetical protein